MWSPSVLEEEPSASEPRWRRVAGDCVGDLLGVFVELRRGEAEEVLDVAFVAESLAGALVRLFEALRLDAEPTRALREAVTFLDRALAPVSLLQDPALQPLRTGLLDARAAALQAVDASISAVWLAPPAIEELRASDGTLRLHGRVTPPLLPQLPLLPPVLPQVTETPEPLPAPATVEELQAAIAALRKRADARAEAKKKATPPQDEAGTPAETEPPVEPEAEIRFVEEQARICFEDVAMLCTQRAPELGEAWRSVEVLEARLRACIDAIAALGRPALQCIQAQVLEAPAFDPARLLAFTLVCGAVDGADALALAEWAFEALLASYPEEEEALHAAFTEGLGLVPHPGVVALCERLLRSSSVRHRMTGLEVLIWRRAATDERLREALRDEPRVAALALPALATGRPPDLRELVDGALGRGETLLRVPAWQAMCLAGDPRLNTLLAAELRSTDGDAAARLLGINAERRDAERLLEEAAVAPTAALVEALGFAGSPGAVPLLTGLLEVDDFDLQLAAGRALIRITGWELWEEIRISPERVAGEPASAPTAQPSRAATGQDPRDAAESGSEDVIELPTLRAAPWREYWQAYGHHFDAGRRYRRGLPHEPLLLVEDLLHQRALRPERQLMILELMSRTGRDVPLDVRGWVHDQCATLEALREGVTSSAAAGDWTLPRHR